MDWALLLFRIGALAWAAFFAYATFAGLSRGLILVISVLDRPALWLIDDARHLAWKGSPLANAMPWRGVLGGMFPRADRGVEESWSSSSIRARRSTSSSGPR